MRLGTLLSVKHGFAFRGEYFADSGSHIVLTPGNFKEEGGFIDRRDKAKWYQGPIPGQYVLPAGSLLVAMTEQAEGLLGSSAIVPRSSLYLHNQRLGLVEPRDLARADARFLYYLFNHRPVRQQIRASASGTKIRHTSPSRIEAVVVPIPDLDTQRRIAAMLAAYDDLIENCQRRICILEDMVRGLYREWFVHFHFLGADDVPRVDSPLGPIPRGWTVKFLGDVCDLTMGQSPKSEFYNTNGEGLPFHQGVTDFGARFPVDRVFCTTDGRMAKAGDILFSVRAPVGRMNLARREIILGRGVAAIRHREGAQSFLWEQLRSIFHTEDLIGNGAIFAAVTKKQMQEVALLCPPSNVVLDASKHFDATHAQLERLGDKISNLRRTRDLLLPRLMSGQIDLRAAEDALPA